MSGVQLLSQQFFAIKKETVRNTAELVPDITLKVDSNTMFQQIEYTLDEVVYRDRDNNYDEYQNMGMAEGEITGHINNEDIGRLLYYALGVVASTQIAASTAYRHDFQRIEDHTQLPTFTAFYSYGESGLYKARGCVIDELSLEIGESESKFTATIKAIEEVKVTDPTEITNIQSAVVYSDPDPKLTFGNLVFTYADSLTDMGAIADGTAGTGTTMNLRPGLTINISNNVEYDTSSSSAADEYIKPLDTIAQKFQASLEFSGLIRNSDPYDFTLQATKKAYEALMVNVGAEDVGDSTVKPELRFRVSSAIAKTEVETALNEALAYNINLDNLLNTPQDGTSLFVSIVNTTTSY